MRFQLWLPAAAWALGQGLGLRGGEQANFLPRETRASTYDMANGWTPSPTESPSTELLRRRQDWAIVRRQASKNTGADDTVCGWYSGIKCELLLSSSCQNTAEPEVE